MRLISSILPEIEHSIARIRRVLTSEEPDQLWKRNLVILWAAQFIAMIGMNAMLPILPLYVRELGVTNHEEAQRWSGYVFSAVFLLAPVFTPIWGMMGDRYGRKKMIIRAVIGLAFSVGLMGFAQNVYQLALLRVLQGALSGFIAANLSFVSSDVPQLRIGYALGLMQTSTSSGTVIGPLIGGAISDAFGFRFVFFFVFAVCLISAYVVVRFVRESQQTKVSLVISSFRENLRFALAHKQMRWIFLVTFLAQVCIVFPSPILVFFLESLGVSPSVLSSTTGLLVACVGFCMVLASPWWGRRTDRFGISPTIKIASLIVMVSVLLQSVATNVVSLFALRIVSGLFIAGIIPGLYSALSKHSPAGMRGGIMGLASSVMFIANLIGPSSSGFISSHTNPRWSIAISSIFMLIVFLVVRARKLEMKEES